MNFISLKRNRAFELLGTRPTNPRWSWCALSPDNKRAVFTLWKDLIENGRSPLLWPNYDVGRSHGAKDQRRILELVLTNHIPAYALVCIAHNPNFSPRSIKEVKADYLIKLKIEKVGNMMYGHHLDSVLFAEVVEDVLKPRYSKHDGLNDLESSPNGNETPDRAHVSSMVVVRNSKVRTFVIRQAQGQCEYCGKPGFEMNSGARYVEAHHIISLAEEGKDMVDNVIALCPEHHREAHYGKDAELLEEQFQYRPIE